MSRHTLGIATGHLVLGWDPPLQTFFLQVHDRTGHIRVWLGCAINEIVTVDALIRAGAPHLVGTIWENGSADLRRRLEAEQRGNVA